MKRTILTAALILSICLAVFGAGAEGAMTADDYLGIPLPDFSVETVSGETFTLSEALSEKDAVLINLWATWCGPCGMEFPYLEEAYEQYSDRVAVIALSVEENDTPEVLRQYAEEHGLTFAVASDSTTGFGSVFAVNGIPTSVVVDKFGNVCLIETNSQTRTDAFTGLFDELLSEDYTQTRVFESFPKSKPSAELVSDSMESLASAFGPGITVMPSDDECAWPFAAAEIDGKACAESTNAGRNDSHAELTLTVTAKADEVLAFSLRVSSENIYDYALIEKNGEQVKRLSGDTGWLEYAVALDEGGNTVTFKYVKDAYGEDGDDTLCVADLRVLGGDDGLTALEAAPAYPYADETALTLLNEGAKEIAFDEAYEGALAELLGCGSYRAYIVYSDTAEAACSIGREIDADNVVIYSNFDGSTWLPADIIDATVTTGIDSMDTTGYAATFLSLTDMYDGSAVTLLMLIRDDENADEIANELRDGYGAVTGYHFVETAAETPETLTWTAVFVDQDGAPVPGCVINFCDDESCTPVFSGEDGVAVFTSETAQAWHLQVIKVPDGYSFDTAQEFLAEENGGEMTFTVNKD